VATVPSLKELVETNPQWSKIDRAHIAEGDVVFWQKVTYEDGSENAHVGFAITATDAISTNYKTKMIARHPLDERNIESIYRYTAK
jgi:hypothetical protein